MERLGPRERRLAALFLLLLAAGLAWGLVIHPIAAGFVARAERRDLLTATFQRDERVIGQLPSLARAAARQRQEAGRFRFDAPDEAGATALLVRRLTDAVAAANGTSVGVEPMAGGPAVARARVEARLAPAQLGAFLAAVEKGTPVVAVDALAIDATTPAGEPDSGLLDVRLEVSAYFSNRSPATPR